MCTIFREIEGAVQALKVDKWTTKGKDVRRGDRVAIWKAQGGPGGKRGVIALGEMISDSEMQLDDENEFWVDPSAGRTVEMRVNVRYVHAPPLPLWFGESGVVEKLSVSRGQGTVFVITPEQWDELVEAAGGWPEDVGE